MNGPCPSTIARLRQAANSLANGATPIEAAEAAGLSVSTLRRTRNRYKSAWQEAVAQAGPADGLSPDSDTAAGQAAPCRRPRRREPTPKIANRLRQALRMKLAGRTYVEASKAVGVAVKTLEGNRGKYRAWCKAELAVIRSELEAAGHDLQPGLSDEVKERVRRATALVAAGLRLAEVADELGLTLEAVHYCQETFPRFWQRELDRAMRAAVVVVTRQAGTSAVLEDPTAFLRQAMRVDRWARSKGRELFPASGAMTLTRFFGEWYTPTRLTDAAPGTKETYKATLNRWRLLTGDPPLAEITTTMLAFFRDALTKCRVRKGVTAMSPTTICRHMRAVNILLAKAGPPGPRNRDAAGIIPGPVPWVKSPRMVITPPRIVSEEEITALYNVASCMDQPTGLHCRPGDWWRAVLVFAWNTGQRAGTILTLEWPWIDFGRGLATIPPTAVKSRRWSVVPLNKTVLDHLRKIRRADGAVFPWPFRRGVFYQHFHHLQDLAGIPRDQHFGIHAIRKTLATRLWGVAPEAAVLALGHAGADVTLKHYVQGPEIVARAFERLDQPAAFEQPSKKEA